MPTTTPSVSVCIPARNEAATVGELVRAVRRHPRVVADGEVLVLDHASTDDTAANAAAAGATVLSADNILADFGPALGKGDVLWRSVHASRGDIIVWLDADLRSYTDAYITNLVFPFDNNDAVTMVRPDYSRTLNGRPDGGGRITESIAKPLIRSRYPQLSHIHQPLAGEYAMRRSIAEVLPFEIDYGVEVGLLIDVAERCGADTITQVPLPARVHRNRPEAELLEPGRQVERTILSRIGLAERHVRLPLATLAASTAEFAVSGTQGCR